MGGSGIEDGGAERRRGRGVKGEDVRGRKGRAEDARGRERGG